MNTMTANATTSACPVISSDRVEGTTVYNQRGEKLGTIDNLVIDKISGHVRYAVLEFGGFLGMGTDRYPLPWDMLDYEPEKGGYVVPIDKAKLTDAPRFPKEQRPEFDNDYGRTVYDYYGVAWM